MVTNGKNKWIAYLVGVLVTLIVFITLPTLANQMIQSDRLSRERDEKLDDKIDDTKDCIVDKLDSIIREQSQSRQDFAERLARIETKLEE